MTTTTKSRRQPKVRPNPIVATAAVDQIDPETKRKPPTTSLASPGSKSQIQPDSIELSIPQAAASPAVRSPSANADPLTEAAMPGKSAPVATTQVASPDDTSSWRVADAIVLLNADTLDDLEKTRIATENRLRSLTADEDWGKRVNPDLPEVQALNVVLDQIAAVEHTAELNLKRAVRAHPLAPWIKRTVGVGEKQGARLLAALGDPTWNFAEDRLRRGPAELWAYAGLHVLHPGGLTTPDSHRAPAARVDSELPANHTSNDAHSRSPGGDQIAAPSDQDPYDTQTPSVGGVAPFRARGQRANWNATAKMRLWLIAQSCVKVTSSPYRLVYDEGRVKYADAAHQRPCVRCGPAGKPAQVASPLSLGHQHARALRLVMKRVLLDLWREARALKGLADETPETEVAA